MPRNAYLLGIAVKCQAIAGSWMDPERLAVCRWYNLLRQKNKKTVSKVY
jgi:hypothetical protein